MKHIQIKCVYDAMGIECPNLCVKCSVNMTHTYYNASSIKIRCVECDVFRHQ